MQGIDAVLIRKCREKDELALYQLYRLCYPLMKGIAMRYVFDRDRIGEVVNSGFLKVVNGLKSYDHQQSIKPWISTIMVRVCIDYVRKHMRSVANRTDLHEDMTIVNGAQKSYNAADLQFDVEELLQMLEELPDQSRLVFTLYAIEGFSHKEVGEKLGITEGTSKWHVSKARQTLQAKITANMNKKRSDYEPSY